MAQPYTALQLITRAYYLSGVVAREGQTVSASQIDDGLYLLNALLDIKGSDLRLIPYFTRYEFDTVGGQELYYIPNLLFVDALTFNIGPVRYSMSEKTREDYFDTARVDNLQSLPFSYRCERILGGMNIYLYFVPDQVYRMKMSGKFALADAALNTNMASVYDLYYIEYLRYALAEYICCEFGTTFPDSCKAKFDEIRSKLVDVSPADLSIRKKSYFTGNSPMDWQVANLSKGWFPF